MCNPTDILTNAYNIGLLWEKYNYTPNHNTLTIHDKVRNFELLYYDKSNRVVKLNKKYNESDGVPIEFSNSSNIKIFGYMYNTESRYVSLLNFNAFEVCVYLIVKFIQIKDGRDFL